MLIILSKIFNLNYYLQYDTNNLYYIKVSFFNTYYVLKLTIYY